MNNDLKTQDVLTQYGLDFRIEKQPLVGLRPIQSVDGNGQLVESFQHIESPYFGLYNDKTGEIINTVKNSYVVSQNDELVELVLQGMKGFGELSVQNAGSMNGGRKVYIQLGVEGYASVGKDKIKRYVTIIDSNDGSTGLSVGVGDLTMSCQNQFYSFYRNGEAKWRHSASLVDKMATIPSLIKLALNESMRLIKLYNQFESTACSRELAHQMVNHITGIDKTMDKNVLSEKSTRSLNAMNALYDNIEHQMNDKGNNIWGLHSGVTRWTTHDKSAPTRENGRFESLVVGNNYKTNQKSLDFATKMLANA